MDRFGDFAFLRVLASPEGGMVPADTITDGSTEYIRALVSGDFDDERFLTVPVGCKVELTYEKDIFRAVPR